MKHFLSAWITGLGNQNASNVIDHVLIMSSLALLLHIVLSLTACSYVIIFKMYLENFCDWTMSD